MTSVMVVFPSLGRHCPLANNQFILLGDKGTYMCEQLAKGCYLTAEQPGGELVTCWVTSPMSRVAGWVLYWLIHHQVTRGKWQKWRWWIIFI